MNCHVMPKAIENAVRRVVLAGNPNVGKSAYRRTKYDR